MGLINVKCIFGSIAFEYQSEFFSAILGESSLGDKGGTYKSDVVYILVFLTSPHRSKLGTSNHVYDYKYCCNNYLNRTMDNRSFVLCLTTTLSLDNGTGKCLAKV